MNLYEAIYDFKSKPIKCVNEFYTFHENPVYQKYLRATRFSEVVALLFVALKR